MGEADLLFQILRESFLEGEGRVRKALWLWKCPEAALVLWAWSRWVSALDLETHLATLLRPRRFQILFQGDLLVFMFIYFIWFHTPKPSLNSLCCWGSWSCLHLPCAGIAVFITMADCDHIFSFPSSSFHPLTCFRVLILCPSFFTPSASSYF